MDIGSILLTAVGGMIIGVIIGPICHELGLNIGKQIMARVFGTVDLYVKDIRLAAKIKDEIIRVQNSLDSLEGKDKMEHVKNYAKMIIPGNLDDGIVENIIQGIYDGMKTQKTI